MRVFFENLVNSKMFKVLCIAIVFDTVFGVLRAIREKSLNSTIGIDGIIRKVGMLLSALFLGAIDYEISINLIGFIYEPLRNAIGVEYIGFNEIFNILFVLFEMLSTLKNMILCKLPIPKEWQEILEKTIKKFTNEFSKVYSLQVRLKETEGEVIENGKG